MINLMPPQTKEAILYGRKNRALIGWVVAFSIVLLVVVLLTIGGSLYIQVRAHSISSDVEQARQRISEQNLESAQKDAQVFSNNLDTVMSILKDQLLFSKIIRNIGSVLPNGVVLKEINYQSKDSSMTLDVIGGSEYDVTQAFVNISSNSNTLFSKADLVQVRRDEQGTYVANIVVLINKDSEFYFLNNVTNATKESQ